MQPKLTRVCVCLIDEASCITEEFKCCKIGWQKIKARRKQTHIYCHTVTCESNLMELWVVGGTMGLNAINNNAAAAATGHIKYMCKSQKAHYVQMAGRNMYVQTHTHIYMCVYVQLHCNYNYNGRPHKNSEA